MAEGNGIIRLGTVGRRLDSSLIEQGVERECPLREGLTVRILPAAGFNPRFRKALRRRAEEVASRLLGDEQDDDAPTWMDDAGFIAETVVADMRGLYDGEGKPVPYTPELGARILSDPGHLDVRDWIVGEATRYEAYYAQTLAKRSGNSRRGSSGKKAGAERSARTRS